MTHPLDGCDRRIVRADRYIKETEGLLRIFAGECEDYIIACYNTPTLVQFPGVHPDLPLAISDAVHNLRAALDYLVYELALKDSGQPQDGTQFPIEPEKFGISADGNKFGFDVVAPRFLRGLSPAHRDAIEKFQPYNGADWAQTLKDISNPDKHRQLIPISVDTILGVWVHGPDVEGKKLPSGDTIKADPTHTVYISLANRAAPLRIVPTLYQLQGAAMDTVNFFRREPGW